MANEEHVEILEQGVEVWNQWRKDNPDVRPNLYMVSLSRSDLSYVNLRDADMRRSYLAGTNMADAILFGANLSHANLSNAFLYQGVLSTADLKYANLTGSNLSYAILESARLDNANLSGANLRGANLSYVDLYRVNLLEADLYGTNLSRARLSGANFVEAKVKYTNFSNIDLREVKGLDKVQHKGPSIIGIDTIYKSKGQIPEVFLHGAGVPQSFIDNMKFTISAASAIEFYSCFISYSSNDEEFAKRLHTDLQQEGLRLWFAPGDMKIGDKIRQRIDESIRMYDKLLLVLSENSIDSVWVEKEVEAAFEKEDKQKKLVLFPIRIDNTVMESDQAWAADIRRQRNIGDFTNWKDHDSYKTTLDRLLRDLKAPDDKA